MCIRLTQLRRPDHGCESFEIGLRAVVAASDLLTPGVTPEIQALANRWFGGVSAPDHEGASLIDKGRTAVLRFSVVRIAGKPHQQRCGSHFGIGDIDRGAGVAVGIGHRGRHMRPELEFDQAISDGQRRVIAVAVRQPRRERDIAGREERRAGVNQIGLVAIDVDRGVRLRRRMR